LDVLNKVAKHFVKYFTRKLNNVYGFDSYILVGMKIENYDVVLKHIAF